MSTSENRQSFNLAKVSRYTVVCTDVGKGSPEVLKYMSDTHSFYRPHQIENKNPEVPWL